MISVISIIIALILDKGLGEPRRLHPLVGFGQIAQSVEKRIYADLRVNGAIALMVLLLPFVVLVLNFQRLPGAWVANIIILYSAIGWNSLEAHAQQVRIALVDNDLPLAREQVGYLVSRETQTLDEQGVAKATVESVLENGNDAIFAVLFWFVVAGAPGVVLYRLGNTLDAMWGYRNSRYKNFGWAAARLDDVLNYIPARLTAFSYALAGKFSQAINCWRTQGAIWKSPSAGPVMAAGAGSIGVVLGGPEIYHGELQNRIALGQGHSPDTQSIEDAKKLIQRALMIWVALLFAGEFIFA